jgi:hypothetical protein
MQQGWGAARIVQRPAHRQNAGVQDRIAHVLPWPHLRQQLLLGHHPVPVGQEIRQ